MASFTVSSLAGTVLAELPLDDPALDFVVSDLLDRLPPTDSAWGVPRLLLGPRELGWSERLGDLALTPGAVVTLVLMQDPEKAAADLMGTEGTPVRLAAAKALCAMGAAAAGQAGKLVDAALSDPDAEVVGAALQALRDIGAAVEPGSAAFRSIRSLGHIAQLAQDLEDPEKLPCEPDDVWHHLRLRLLVLLQQRCCDASPGQAALRRGTVLRRLAPLDPRAARRREPLLADPLDDPRPEVRLARVAVLGGDLQALEDIGDTGSKLSGMLVGDACLDVRRRAAERVGRASRRGLGRLLVDDLTFARAALDAEVEALRRSALPADCCRMEAVQSIQKLLG